MDGIDDLLPQCDFVLIACPLTAETRGLIDARRLRLMRPQAVLVNVARAAIVDEEALFQALSSRSIAGAVLDVWYAYPTAEEPQAKPSRFPFESLDNVTMTPHASAWTDELIARRWRFIAANLDRFARGEALQNVVIRDGHLVS
jgi:phosphoglycerate dehydrogenase-like enzyme